MTDLACLSHWFPLLLKTGVPVPETRIVRTDVRLDRMLDGDRPLGFSVFRARLDAAAIEVGGYPCFLRTGHGSGKHRWAETCHVKRQWHLETHVHNLVEWSAMVDMAGLPTDVWAVRELLSLESSFTAYDGFPVNRERRYFIGGGRVLCHHPYWPEAAVAQGRPAVADWPARLAALNEETPEEVAHLTVLSEQVAQHFDGSWSLDWARTMDGAWYAIDMAPAARSFHWAGCQAAEQP